MSGIPTPTSPVSAHDQVSEADPLQDHSSRPNPAVTKLPFETLEAIFTHLSPRDFNAARHTCRTWYYAGSGRLLLVEMVQRAGWWSSIKRLVGNPRDPVMPWSAPDDRERMAKWLAREMTLAGGGDKSKSPFVLAGLVDFSSLAANYSGSEGVASPASMPDPGNIAIAFTVSACGRFLMLSHGRLIHIYELNHMCEGTRRPAWHARLKPTRHHPIGSLRPVTTVVCDGNVVRCSMDTSRGRYAVAALLEGRRAVVVEIRRERMTGVLLRNLSSDFAGALHDDFVRETGPPSKKPKTGSTMVATCICEKKGPFCAPSLETGARTYHRNLCTGIDPPRSVAICPQRNCIVFGSACGVELH
ncbi:hypothetical protein ACRALDRAFT_2025136 [Sodiomyces alcalophilus JCM 7366]|uniref:uncharacterized protein n=1 Tax=Sodiomyces alcalophilus JCM 7366 TaxID=591952 RepID=UPI0039B4F618